MSFDWLRFPRSLWRASRTLVAALRREHNFRLQVVGALAVVVVSWWLGIGPWELAIIIVAVATVPALELVNSALERLVDLTQPRVHDAAAAIKDLMAAAVLVAALAALAVVLLMWWPYLPLELVPR